jgi:hypothetical protein
MGMHETSLVTTLNNGDGHNGRPFFLLEYGNSISYNS